MAHGMIQWARARTFDRRQDQTPARTRATMERELRAQVAGFSKEPNELAAGRKIPIPGHRCITEEKELGERSIGCTAATTAAASRIGRERREEVWSVGNDFPSRDGEITVEAQEPDALFCSSDPEVPVPDRGR